MTLALLRHQLLRPCSSLWTQEFIAWFLLNLAAIGNLPGCCICFGRYKAHFFLGSFGAISNDVAALSSGHFQRQACRPFYIEE
jgi:hypothetical protein